MTEPRWYSPKLARETVRRLYFQAKEQHLPMTVLANRLIEEALGNKKRINTRKTVEDQHLTKPS